MALIVGVNSYISVADATTILADRFGLSDWDAADPVTKAQALVTATSAIDERRWLGFAVSASQPLGWPRTSAKFVDPKLNLIVNPANDEIPERVKLATTLQALHFIQFPAAYASEESIAESITVGPISISDSNSRTKTVKFPYKVVDLLKPLTVRGNSGYTWWMAN